MAVSDSDVIEVLTTDGASVEDHFLIGHEICVVNHNGQLMSLLVEEVEGEEEGEMYLAILDFLRRRGARVYQSHEEYINQQSESRIPDRRLEAVQKIDDFFTLDPELRG